MKKDKTAPGSFKKIYRVDLQVFLMTAIIVVISCGITFVVSYCLTYNGMIRALRSRANSIYEYADGRLDVETFRGLNSRADGTSYLYQEAKKTLENVRTATGVRYLYTAKEKEDGTFIYLVDGLPVKSKDFHYIGDAIEPECIPDMKMAMENQVVLPKKIKHTSWGNVFIAYFPMHDEERVVGVLGIEFDASDQYRTFRSMQLAAPVIICIFCIITAVIAVMLFRRISNPAYQDMANTDLLTGLKNRNAFEVDIHNLETVKVKSGFAFVSVDLDGLKRINDTFGHAAGDKYIQAGCKILKSYLPKQATLYRTGGDEFTIILKEVPREHILEMIEKSCRRRRVDGLSADTEIQMSAGYAFYDEETDASLEDTYKRADAQMYEQKKEKYRDKIFIGGVL